RECPLVGKREIRVGLRVFGARKLEGCRGQLDTAEAPRAQTLADCADREYRNIHRRDQRLMTSGTLKYPDPETGAFANASSVPKPGRARSGRSVAVSSA